MDAATQLEYLRTTKLNDCTRCELHHGRTKLVFGAGSPEADLMFVGEGPGFNEDRVGEPFVGAAGVILNNLLRHSALRREQVYIANCVKCRPPKNRDPLRREIAACTPFLHAQIAIVRPRVLVALGRFAGNALAGHVAPLSMEALMADDWTYTHAQLGQTIPVVCLYHPAYIHRRLHSPEIKTLYREAVGKLRKAKAAHLPLELDL